MFRKSLFVIVCLAIPCMAFADTIYMKNGKQIKDVEAIEEGDAVKYQKFGSEISIPKGNVDHIEKIELPKEVVVKEEDKNDDHIQAPSLEADPDLSTCPKVKIWGAKILRYRNYQSKIHAGLVLKKMQFKQDGKAETPEAVENDAKLKQVLEDWKLADSLQHDLDIKMGTMKCGK